MTAAIQTPGFRDREAPAATGAAAPAAAAPDAAAVYALGSNPAESARLGRQATELRPEGIALLDRIGLKPGDSAIDLGCGPAGILDLLSAAVGPAGRVVGLDADPAHVAMAREYASREGLGNVEVRQGDARETGLPPGSFDLVHGRTLLVTIPEPAEVVAEMARLAKPGGWVASQEPDIEHRICYPPLPAWDRMGQIFQASFSRSGADLRIGRRLAELHRDAGLTDVSVVAHAGVYPAGHSRRTILPDLMCSLRPTAIELGLADEQELDALDRAVREHLADPRTVSVGHLLFAVWGRRPPR